MDEGRSQEATDLKESPTPRLAAWLRLSHFSGVSSRMTTINPEWPSFREWQTTKIKQPQRQRCALRWMLRDWTEAQKPLQAALRSLSKAFSDIAKTVGKMTKVFREAGLIQ